jgi:LacI family transcriptional regulator
MAMGAMDAVRNRGLRVPEDISILGFDDIPQSEVVRPALTTVRQPLRDMGAIATQMLIEKLNFSDKEITRIELPTELIVRASTMPPKNKAG